MTTQSDRAATASTDVQRQAPRAVMLATGECLRIGHGDYAAAITDGFQPALIVDLADNRIPALHMRNAVDHAWCEQVAERFARHPATKREGVTPAIYSLGSHLYSCPKGEVMSCYFRQVEQNNSYIADVLPHGHDPAVAFLRHACVLSNAEFEFLACDGASVRHGALRLWGEDSGPVRNERCYFAVPHEDYAETNANFPMLEQIYDCGNLFSLILCIDAVAGREPETIVWDRRLSLTEIRDPGNRHPWASYGFDEALFAGVEATSIQLKKGDAAVIPAHNVHAIIGFPGHRRCTYMAFFHLRKTAATGFSRMIFRT